MKLVPKKWQFDHVKKNSTKSSANKDCLLIVIGARRCKIFEIDDWLFAYFEKIHVECHRRTSTFLFLRVNVPSNVDIDVQSWRYVEFD